MKMIQLEAPPPVTPSVLLADIVHEANGRYPHEPFERAREVGEIRVGEPCGEIGEAPNLRTRPLRQNLASESDADSHVVLMRGDPDRLLEATHEPRVAVADFLR